MIVKQRDTLSRSWPAQHAYRSVSPSFINFISALFFTPSRYSGAFIEIGVINYAAKTFVTFGDPLLSCG